jgi:hypothetical protein
MGVHVHVDCRPCADKYLPTYNSVFVKTFPFRENFYENHRNLFVFAIIFLKIIKNFGKAGDFCAAARICYYTHIFA